MEEFSQLIANTINPNAMIRQPAEQQLNTIVLDQSMMDVLFRYIADLNTNFSLKQAVAVFLMRNVKDFWYDDTEKAIEFPQKVINKEAQNYFLNNILNLVFNVEIKLIPVLKETIVFICQESGGYQTAWPELMTILAKFLKNKNHQFSPIIYDLIHKVTKRYRSEIKSHSLFSEISNTLTQITQILTEDAITCINFIFSDEKNSREGQIIYLTMLRNILNIFINLNAQDFPEYFEDNLGSWINILKASLEFRIDYNPNDLEIQKLFIKIKKVAMEALNEYCEKYYEDIQNYHNDFFSPVWGLVIMIKHELLYEKLIKELLDYYKTVFKNNRMVGIGMEVLKELINNLVIPEMKLSNKELDDYEDNAINFLKIELEETDTTSNKYHAILVLTAILNYCPDLKNNFINPHINNFLSNYYQNPQKNHMDKICAINLIFATTIRIFSQKIGATSLLVEPAEIMGLIETVFLKEFNEVNNSNPLARIYSLKFLSTFRLQIPQDWMTSVINMLLTILNQSDNIIQTAILLTLENILFMKDIQSNTSLVKDAVNDQQTFLNLIQTLVKVSSGSINLFAMKCLFKTVFLTQEGYFQHILDSLSMSINEILKLIIANPIEDQFNYYLFETIAMLMKKLMTVNPQYYHTFYNYIKANLYYIIENFITDLIGYVFQINGLILSYTSDGEGLNDPTHKNILSSLLFTETNWTLHMKYLFNPFVSYLKVSMIKCKFFYESNNSNMDQIFKIMNKLLELKSYNLCFDLLDRVMNTFNFDLIYENVRNLFQNFYLISENLKVNNVKAFKQFSRIFIIFISKVLIKTNSKVVIEILQTATGGDVVMFLSTLINNLMDLDPAEKKLVLYAICTLMVDFHSSFNVTTLNLFTQKILEMLEKFSKFNLNYGNIDSLLSGDDLSYSANNFNKLINAEVIVKYQDYSQIYQIDPHNLFFETMNKIKILSGYDLIENVYNTLGERTKEYIKSKTVHK